MTDQTEANEIAAYAQKLIDIADRDRMPELFEPNSNAYYQIHDRNGVSVTVLPTTALDEDHIIRLLKYRLAQYLPINFVDAQRVYRERIEHEPRSHVLPQDIHVIAGSAATGQILCYLVIKSLPDAPAGTTLETRERPLFPAEKTHGWGVYNRLRLLPDIPVHKIREIGRFVKNQQLSALDELGVRGPIEVGVAAFRTLVGPLRADIDAIVGDLEEGIAAQNLKYFHVPMVLIHGTIPYEGEDDYLFPRYQFCNVFPFAVAVSDVSLAMKTRLNQIEDALNQTGKQAMRALLALKKDLQIPKSSLEPAAGMTNLNVSAVPQKELKMQQRRELLDLGNKLRKTELFSGLSVAEASILRNCMETVSVAPGEHIVKQGDFGDDLFLIEEGEAEVRIADPSGKERVMRTMGPGEYFGEIGLLTGGIRTANVIAKSRMQLMRLDNEHYGKYLEQVPDVDRHLHRMAAQRAVASFQQPEKRSP